jgi:hypothetical protein
MPHNIQTIQQFYALMQETGKLRRKLVGRILEGESPDPQASGLLRSFLDALQRIPHNNGRFVLTGGAGQTQTGKILYLELDYEITELEKDLIFLEKGEGALLSHLAELHPGFQEELDGALEFCRALHFPVNSLISDRDGTVNNYCGRYLSSIQSAYNAVFLSRFAQTAAKSTVILTSAPLSGGGLEEITVTPPGIFILAGSKGREYLDGKGGGGRLPIEREKQKKLDQLNHRIEQLMRDPQYELFSLIGSGLQFKFGQTTVARQDIYGSIPDTESEAFMKAIEELIRNIDPRGEFFRTEDTGKDIEIILTVEGESGLKDFDKGDGVSFLDVELDLGLARGGNLVCGDTSSDIPMAAAARAKSLQTSAIFVTPEIAIKRAVRRICERAHFVSEPDVLVCLFNQLGKDRG